MSSVVKLGGLVTFRTGKLNSNAAKPDGAYPFFTCSQETYRTNTFSFDTECVLLAGNNANGIYPIKYFNGRFDAYQRTYVIESLNKKILLTRFLFYALRLQLTHLRSVSTGSATKFLTMPLLTGIEVRLPSLAKQERIVSILSAYDDLIENNTRRIAILEEMARRLYEEWFVRFRFPGHEGSDTTEGLPAGWSRTTLGSITTKIGSGATPRGGKSAYFDSGVTLIRSQNIFDYNFVDKGLAFLDDDQAAQLQGVAVESGDVLLNITGASVARCCMVPRRHLPARVNQHVMIIRADSARMEPSYLLCAINSVEMKRQLLAYAQTGSTREALTREMMSQFVVLLPDPVTLRKFGEIAGDIFRQREILADKNANLRTTRDLLLPKLISGELDVSTLPEPQAEAV